MLGAPRVKAVRGFSDFGYSYVYVIFEDGTDIYWARSRTLEYLSAVLPRLPEGVKTELGPDATGLGWVFQYALVDKSGKHSLAELRSYQDWYLRYYLKAVPGVAEVAPVGGFGKQYQVNVDPNRLQAYGIPISRVVEAVQRGNKEVGRPADRVRRHRVHGPRPGLCPVRPGLREYRPHCQRQRHAHPHQGYRPGRPGPGSPAGSCRSGRRQGRSVSGIVVMRQGQNALDVIDRVKAKIKEIEPGLPPGVKIVPIYDRSDLILRAIDNLKSTLVEVILTVSLSSCSSSGTSPAPSSR